MNESMKKENNKEGLYSPKGKVSLGQAVPMALQHVVAMVVGCISMPMLVAGAGGISGSEQIVMIQASLLGLQSQSFCSIIRSKVSLEADCRS